MTYGPLMDAIWCGKNGRQEKESRWAIYGWLEPGANISTSNTSFNKVTGTGGNFPAAYSYQPDTVQLDQCALYVERTPDEVQKDHFDWGFRFAGLYGTNYKYTFADGILSRQYTQEERQVSARDSRPATQNSTSGTRTAERLQEEPADARRGHDFTSKRAGAYRGILVERS
jgi:hypothetical protein